jgi:hypothetical protein
VTQPLDIRDRRVAGIDFEALKIWLSSPRTAGVWVALFIAIYPVSIGSLQAAPPGLEFPFATWLWDLIAGASAAAVILASRLWVKSQGPGRTLLVWLLASIFSAVTPVAIGWLLGEVPVRLIVGIPISALSTFGLLLLFTIVLATFSEYRESNRALSSAVAELELRRKSLSGQLAQRQRALAQAVMDQVAPRIEMVTDLVQGSQNKKAAAALLELIDNLVRPVSRGLSEAQGESARDELEFQANPSLLRRVLRRQARRVSLSSIFTPHLHVIFAVVFFTGAMYLVAGFKGVGVLFAFLALCSASYLALRALSRSLKLPYIVIHVLNLVLALSVSRLFIEFARLFGILDQGGLTEFVGFGLFLVFGFAGFVSIYVAGKEGANRDLLLVAQRLSAIVGELQLKTAALKRQLGLQLHSEIQARLQAALVRLSRTDAASSLEIEQILGDLESARTSLLIERAPTEGLVRFDEMVELWDGICEVTITIDSESKISLENNEELCVLVFEIVSERIVNAVKHSSAEEIDITIDKTQNRLAISSRNQNFVDRQNTTSVAGGGSKFLDAACLSWSLTFEANDVAFWAEVLCD